jgi:hypothetical protein
MSESVGEDQPDTNAGRKCESIAKVDDFCVAIPQGESTGGRAAELIADKCCEPDGKRESK